MLGVSAFAVPLVIGYVAIAVHRHRSGRSQHQHHQILSENLRFYLVAYAVVGLGSFGVSYLGSGVTERGCGRMCLAAGRSEIVATGSGAVGLAGHVLAALGIVGVVLLAHGLWFTWSLRRPTPKADGHDHWDGTLPPD